MQGKREVTRRQFIRNAGKGLLVTGLILGTGNSMRGREEQPIVVRTSVQYPRFKSFDPCQTAFEADKFVLRPLFNGLVRSPLGTVKYKPEDIEPSLAASWEVNPEKTEYIFNLRKGVEFHHGYGEFTAEDVKFSYERIEDPKTQSLFKGAHKGWKIEVIDKYTVRIKLPGPDPLFLMKVFPYQAGNIVSKKAVKDLGEEYSKNPIGTGPYEFVEYRPGDRVVLKPYKDHFRGVPGIDRAEFVLTKSVTGHRNALWSHYAHIGAHYRDFREVIQGTKRAGGFVMTCFGLPSPGQLFINTNRVPFDDIRVRKAVCHATNNEQIATVMGQGTKYVQPINTGWDHSKSKISGGLDLEEPIYPYNPDRSRKLLSQAGYPNGFDAGTVVQPPIFKQPMEAIQALLSNVGIRFHLQIRDWSAAMEYSCAGRNPFSFYWCTRAPDAAIYLTEFLHSASIGAYNFAQWSNEKFDELVDQAKRQADLEEREKMLQQAQMIALKEAVIVPTITSFYLGTRDKHVDLGYEMKNTLIYIEYLCEKTSWVEG